jgi:hypothetical protein
VSRANGRPVVALVNLAEMDHAADVRETGVRFIYSKHPIMRMAHIRKLEVRKAIAEQEFRRAAATAALPQSRATASRYARSAHGQWAP